MLRLVAPFCAALVLGVSVPEQGYALNRAGDPNAPALAIAFKPHQNCWRYVGKEAYFTGVFHTGDHLIITAAGEAHFADPATGRELVRVEPREVSFSQAKPYRGVSAIAEGEFIVPLTGRYDISLWPHAIQGFEGILLVCKR